MDKISKQRRRELPRNEPRYVSVNAALVRYNLSRQSLYDRIATGRVIAVKDGARTKIDVVQTDALYAALPPATTTVRLHARARRRAELKAQPPA